MMRRTSPATFIARHGSSRLFRPTVLHPTLPYTIAPSRPLFTLFKTKKPSPFQPIPEPIPTLSQENLFHPLSQSPFPDLQAKSQRVKAVSICPVSVEKHSERVRPAYDCPDCGWPTHKDRSRWEEGWEDHQEVCQRLREVNEDENDLRSGRRMNEFENHPKQQNFDQAISFANWDTLFFTRDFPSIDSERSVRHVSKVLTYPMTIGGVLHENGPFTPGNGRITRQGKRSMMALHSMLHLPPGSAEHTAQATPQPPMRIFILGARSESTLPPSHWQQLNYLFPRNYFEIYFIGPEVGIPMLTKDDPRRLKGKGYDFTDENEFGVPSYKLNVSPNLTLTSLQSSYDDLHDQFGPFDPYTDIFFSFSPGLGFPHQEGEGRNRDPNVKIDEKHAEAVTTQPKVQAETTWKATLQKILSTKCPLFFTAFSPLDLQRDVSALYGTNPPSFRHGGANSRLREFPDYVGAPASPVGHIEGVTDEFELILTPGKNTFGSLRWEIAEWDVRVAVKTNWGVWGIRGKKYEVVETGQVQE